MIIIIRFPFNPFMIYKITAGFSIESFISLRQLKLPAPPLGRDLRQRRTSPSSIGWIGPQRFDPAFNGTGKGHGFTESNRKGTPCPFVYWPHCSEGRVFVYCEAEDVATWIQSQTSRTTKLTQHLIRIVIPYFFSYHTPTFQIVSRTPFTASMGRAGPMILLPSLAKILCLIICIKILPSTLNDQLSTI